MNNIKVSIFDLVSFIIPGIVILISFAISINSNIKCVADIIEALKKIDLITSFVLLGLAYVIGFATYDVGSSFYRRINKLFWKDKYYSEKYEENENNISYRWSVIREYSPANFVVINRWAALKGMAQNLTVGLIILSIVGLTKIKGNEYYIEWIIISISCLVMSVLLLKRARVYKRYRENDLNGTLQMIEKKLKKNENAVEQSAKRS